jgi:hypothetical protein
MPKSKVATILPVKQPKSYRGLLALLTPVLGLALAYLGLRANSPTLYDSNASVSGDQLLVTITNKGRTAQIGKGWCGAGAYLTPGTAQITKFINASTPDIFRRSFLAPDQQDTLDMLVPISVNPDVAMRMNPLMLSLNPDTSWGVVCTIPYWDALGKWIKSDSLNLCYEVQPTGRGNERHAVMCPAESVDRTIRELGAQ